MTTRGHIWRATRNALIILLGLGLGVLTYKAPCISAYAWGGLVLMLLAGLISRSAARRKLLSDPPFGLHALEWQVRLLHTSASILPFAVILWATTTLSTHFSDAASKYVFGVASGIVITGITAALIEPGKSESWTEVFIQKKFAKEFRELFDDVCTKPELPMGFTRRWPRLSMEHSAVIDDGYRNEKGELIDGWGASARLARARTLKAGMQTLR